MAYTSGFTAVSGATFTAAQYNTNVRDNFSALWVYTTAGDISYATSSTAAGRLALVPGGVMYGGASAPAWLATPAADSFLSKASGTGAPSWLERVGMPGVLHAYGKNYTDSGHSTTSGTYTSTTAEVTLDLSYTCTVMAIGIAGSSKTGTTYNAGFLIQIDGENGTASAYYNDAQQVIAAFSVNQGVTSGSRVCKLMYAISNPSETLSVSRAEIHAFAFIEA